MTITLLPPQIHYFKICPQEFAAVEDGSKVHEVRRHDRPTLPCPGDVLVLKCWDPELLAYSGHQLVRRVKHITAPGTFGLPADLYVMSIGE